MSARVRLQAAAGAILGLGLGGCAAVTERAPVQAETVPSDRVAYASLYAPEPEVISTPVDHPEVLEVAPPPSEASVPDASQTLPATDAPETISIESVAAAVPGEVDLTPADDAQVKTDASVDPADALQQPAAVEFKAYEGDMLRATIERWCSAAGYRLFWRAPYDYPIAANATLAVSTLPEAIALALRAAWHTRYPLIARESPPPDRIIIVSSPR